MDEISPRFDEKHGKSRSVFSACRLFLQVQYPYTHVHFLFFVCFDLSLIRVRVLPTQRRLHHAKIIRLKKETKNVQAAQVPVTSTTFCISYLRQTHRQRHRVSVEQSIKLRRDCILHSIRILLFVCFSTITNPPVNRSSLPVVVCRHTSKRG